MWRIILLFFCLAAVREPVGAETIDFSTPPALGPEESESLYNPLLELLSRETGETFRYIHSDDWLAYQRDMQRDRFDLLLDDAHFVSWRIKLLGHVPLATIRDQIRFVVIATTSGKIYSKADLIAHAICAYPQPDLGTISILGKFHRPFQIPQVKETYAPLHRVQRLLAGECAGAVLARHSYAASEEIRSVTSRLKIITQSDAYPGPTFTAGARVPAGIRDAIQSILLSRAAGRATRELRDRIANGGSFVATDVTNYEGLDVLLYRYPGFSR